MSSFFQIVRDEVKLLTFGGMGPNVAQHWPRYLSFGLATTWLAGVGRYWDHPSAEVWQRWGLGSLIYVLVLAAFVWLILAPLRPKRWSYRNVLLFTTLTAPPALLYALPVERWMSLQDAQQANLWFLAVVAAWRVALFWLFLRKVAELPIAHVIVGTMLPLTLIVTALAALNLEQAVFEIMGGIGEGTASDAAYGVVIVLSGLSVMLSPVLLIIYGKLVWDEWRGKRGDWVGPR